MGGNHLRRAQTIHGVWLFFPRRAQSVSLPDSGILEPCEQMKPLNNFALYPNLPLRNSDLVAGLFSKGAQTDPVRATDATDLTTQ